MDEDVDVQNYSEVVWKVLNNIDPERDIQFTLGPIDVLDHSSRQQGFGSKMGIDATRKWKNEGFGNSLQSISSNRHENISNDAHFVRDTFADYFFVRRMLKYSFAHNN